MTANSYRERFEKEPRVLKRVLKKVCVLCLEPFDGFGNNPAPLARFGVCCDVCNSIKVIPARIKKGME